MVNLLKSDLWCRPEIFRRGAHREKSSTTPLRIAAVPDSTLFIIVSALGEYQFGLTGNKVIYDKLRINYHERVYSFYCDGLVTR